MKKTLTAALTAAVVVGSSATTFAAANPFSDVPRGHWAYQAVASLAADGIVEGYGDGTYRGQREITRYEMAQMIAKALARTDALFDQKSGLQEHNSAQYSKAVRRNYHAVKADLDRLSAEFRDELEALGVRISELEKHIDRVTWTGEMRYRYWKDRTDLPGGGKDKPSLNQLQLRFFPTAEVNDHWKVKARLTATNNMSTNNSGSFKLTFAYAQGDYGKLQLKIGKMPLYTKADDGLLFDDFFSGVEAIYGDKIKATIRAGRWNNAGDFSDPASYQAGELSYDNDKLYVGAGYHHLRSDDFRHYDGYNSTHDASIWTVGAHYNFNDDLTLGGSFARNTKADDYSKSYNIALDYKGANKTAGTWGIGAAYRYVGANVSFCPTYDVWGLSDNKKGVDVYASWSPLKNTYTQVNYFWGKKLDTHEKTKTFFGRVSWFF